MIDTINKKLRLAAIIFAATVVALNLIEEKEEEISNDGFQTKKFDDIW